MTAFAVYSTKVRKAHLKTDWLLLVRMPCYSSGNLAAIIKGEKFYS